MARIPPHFKGRFRPTHCWWRWQCPVDSHKHAITRQWTGSLNRLHQLLSSGMKQASILAYTKALLFAFNMGTC
jgi:hypothetical protein